MEIIMHVKFHFIGEIIYRIRYDSSIKNLPERVKETFKSTVYESSRNFFSITSSTYLKHEIM